MKWHKLGKIFCIDESNNSDWMNSYCFAPVVENLSDFDIRMYFNTLGKDGKSRVGFLELDIRNPSKVTRISEKPILTTGELGSYDDEGVSISSILITEEKIRYLYFVGWNLCKTVPSRNSIGLAVSDTDDPYDFTKYTNAPILDRNYIDPYSLSYPWVFKENDTWKMFYGSVFSWGQSKDGQYNEATEILRYAEAKDSIHWERSGNVIIPESKKISGRVIRPCVVRDWPVYKMWFSYTLKDNTYRIGYAESLDGMKWRRVDDVSGISISDTGWDSKDIGLPCVFSCNDQLYLAYNGNRLGESGIGLAILEA